MNLANTQQNVHSLLREKKHPLYIFFEFKELKLVLLMLVTICAIVVAL